jgi:hypothetical protein
MLVLFSKIWWTMSLLCSVTTDFPGWYSWLQQSCSLTLVALEWQTFLCRYEKVYTLHFNPDDVSSHVLLIYLHPPT